MTKNSTLLSLVNKAFSFLSWQKSKHKHRLMNLIQRAHRLNNLHRIFYPSHLKKVGKLNSTFLAGFSKFSSHIIFLNT